MALLEPASFLVGENIEIQIVERGDVFRRHAVSGLVCFGLYVIRAARLLATGLGDCRHEIHRGAISSGGARGGGVGVPA